MSCRSESCSSEGYAALIARARAAAASMNGAIDGQADDNRVSIDVPAFRKVAAMLAELGDRLAGCGGDECMGRPIDGIRLWVTQDRLTVEQARAAWLAEEIDRLRAALRSIADGDLEEIRMAAVLGDASGIARNLRDFAGRALGHA